MSKSTYFTGQPVYSQVIKLLDKAKIQQISLETLGSERYVKRLTGWKHLITPIRFKKRSFMSFLKPHTHPFGLDLKPKCNCFTQIID